MATPEQSFLLKFTSDVASALQGIERIDQKVSGLAKTVDTMQRGLASGWGAMQTALGGFATALSVSKLKEYGGEASAAAKSLKLLDNALVSSGQYTGQLSDALAEQRAELKAKLALDESESAAVQQRLASLGVEGRYIRELTQASLDFAAAKGGDAVGAAELFARGMQGETIQLRGVRVEMDKTLPKAQQFAQLMLRLKAFGISGSAAALVTPAKRVDAAEGDIRKTIGDYYNSFKRAFTGGELEGIQKAAEAFKKTAGGANELKDALRGVGYFLGQLYGNNYQTLNVLGLVLGAVVGLRLGWVGLAATVGPILTTMGGWLTTMGASAAASLGLGTTAAVSFAGALSLLASIVAVVGAAFGGWKLGEFIAELDVSGLKVKEWAELVFSIFTATWVKLKGALASLGGTVVSALAETLAGALGILRSFAEKVNSLLGALGAPAIPLEGLDGMKKGLEDYAKGVRKTREELKSEFDQEFAGEVEGIDQRLKQRAAALARARDKDAADAAADRARKEREALAQKKLLEGLQLPSKKDKGGKGGSENEMKEVKLLTEQVTVAQQLYNAQLSETKLLEEGNEITAREGRQRNLGYAQAYLVKLRELERALIAQIELEESRGNDRGVAKLNVQWAEVRNRILEANKAMRDNSAFGVLTGKVRELATAWGDWQKQTGDFAGKSFELGVNGVADALTGAIFKTKTWGEVFSQVGQQIVGALIQMLVQIAAAQIALAALAAIKYIALGPVGMFFANGGPVYAANGAFMGGPRGTDTIPAWLSPGEYVIRAEAVRRFGRSALDNINAMRLGPMDMAASLVGAHLAAPAMPVARFASGGSVGGRSSLGGSGKARGPGAGYVLNVTVMSESDLRQAVLDHPDADDYIFNHVRFRRKK